MNGGAEPQPGSSLFLRFTQPAGAVQAVPAWRIILFEQFLIWSQSRPYS